MRQNSLRGLTNNLVKTSKRVLHEGRIYTQEGSLVNEHKTRCPSCKSIALYKYGNVRSKQRFLCLMCGRQFLLGCERNYPAERPMCPICGKKMYVYRKETSFMRYRCSDYPMCSGYLKVMNNDILREEKKE
jgi:transposase-like protein